MVSLPSGHASDGQNSTSAWDYFHINSVDKNGEGDYLISARHASSLYKINGTTGDIIWQLGGKGSHFEISDDVLFGFQHDARFWTPGTVEEGIEYVSLFDNAARANGHRGGVEIVHNASRAKVIRLDLRKREASTEVSLVAPGNILAPSQGNVQRLHNDNLFVNWGQGGAITEYRHGDHEVIFHAELDSGEVGQGVQSYRGFRYPWHGSPAEDPAVVAELDNKGELSIHTSWNGDTETDQWHFFAATRHCVGIRARHCRPRQLGTIQRISFETTLKLASRTFADGHTDEDLIYVQAVDKYGKVLRTSSGCKVKVSSQGGGIQRFMHVESQLQL